MEYYWSLDEFLEPELVVKAAVCISRMQHTSKMKATAGGGDMPLRVVAVLGAGDCLLISLLISVFYPLIDNKQAFDVVFMLMVDTSAELRSLWLSHIQRLVNSDFKYANSSDFWVGNIKVRMCMCLYVLSCLFHSIRFFHYQSHYFCLLLFCPSACVQVTEAQTGGYY